MLTVYELSGRENGRGLFLGGRWTSRWTLGEVYIMGTRSVAEEAPGAGASHAA